MVENGFSNRFMFLREKKKKLKNKFNNEKIKNKFLFLKIEKQEIRYFLRTCFNFLVTFTYLLRFILKINYINTGMIQNKLIQMKIILKNI